MDYPDGRMIRRGIVMLGYHNHAQGGEVITTDGVALGSWQMDVEEWCDFTRHGENEVNLSAPSPWMLQDAIADWMERGADY